MKSEHWNDEDGNPNDGTSSCKIECGTTYGVGFSIGWQHGPLGRDGDRKDPNGAFVEDVIKAAVDRLQFYQDGKFASEYNKDALLHLQAALVCLHERTADREKRDVEGTLNV